MVVIHDWTKWEGDYEKSWAEYKSMWITGNKVQYDMCAKYPYHRRKDEIAAKVWIIGRSYMSGIERHSRKGLVGTVEFFYKNGKAIDALFSSLKAVREPLTVQKVQHVIDIHGKFLTILRKLTRNRNAIRSFASKYMHFHCAAVPIFDKCLLSRPPFATGSPTGRLPRCRVFTCARSAPCSHSAEACAEGG